MRDSLNEFSWQTCRVYQCKTLCLFNKIRIFFTADSYILQIQRFEAPVEQPLPVPPTLPAAFQPPIHPPSLPLQSISASLFASKSPQSGKINRLDFT
jgi:hypothetical protein